MARSHGIQNLSVDLMYGLPTQTLSEYLDSIRAAADLDVRHISAYGLKVEDGTKLQTMLQTRRARPSRTRIETADMMDAGIELLEAAGLPALRNLEFCQPGL